AEIRRTLKHVKALSLLCELRHDLNARRPGADDANILARQIHTLMRPVASMIDPALEAIQSRNIRELGSRQTPCRHDAPLGPVLRPPIGRYQPSTILFLEGSTHDARVEPYIAQQIKFLRDIVRIRENLCLGRISLSPGPFLLKLF